jgi:hypothetical protein
MGKRMKSKELIDLLRFVDPEGGTDVCVDNRPITEVFKLPAYYDGLLQTVEFRNGHYYCGYKSEGSKINLSTMGVVDTFADYPVEIDYSETGTKEEALRKTHARLISFYTSMNVDMELNLFTDWSNEKAAAISDENCEHSAKRFFENNIDCNSPLDEHEPVNGVHPSYNERRFAEWDRKYEWHTDSGFLEIRKKEEEKL